MRQLSPPAGTEFRLFVCSDCPEDAQYSYVAPVREGAHPDVSGPLEVCPFCASPFSLCGSSRPLTIGWEGQR